MHGMRHVDLTSPDQGSNPCLAAEWSLNHWTARKRQIITERAQRGQWLAEGQVHKLDHYKAKNLPSGFPSNLPTKEGYVRAKEKASVW